MRGVHPGARYHGVFVAVGEWWRAGGHAPGEGAEEEDLSEFGARVKVCGAEGGVVEFGEGEEAGVRGAEAVHVGRLEDEAGVRGAEEDGEEGEC